MNDLESTLQDVLHEYADASNFTTTQKPESGLNELAAEIHQNAVNNGWWDEPRGLPEILMLCVSELSEALELYRDGKGTLYRGTEKPDWIAGGAKKPEGIAVELADTIIRILD